MDSLKRSLPIVAVFALVVLLSAGLLLLSGCTGSGNKPDAKEKLVIETDDYTLTLPAEWAESTKAIDYDDAVVVCYDGNEDLNMFSIFAEKIDDDEIVGGDIGRGNCFYTKLSDGRTLQVWATNWLYVLWSDQAYENDEEYGDLDTDTKNALIKLSSGTDYTMDDVESWKTPDDLPDVIAAYVDHMESLCKEGLELKK
jgi:hypothetical protein